MSEAVRKRIEWLDCARGIGIILVVYAHILRSLVASGVIATGSSWMISDRVIYGFHMPLFFLLSGFVSRHVPIRDGGRFLKSRALAILYPYFLWSLVQGGLLMAGGHAANHPIDRHQLVSIAWEPIAQFWFLYALFLCQLTLFLPARVVHLLVCIVLALVLPGFDAPGIVLLTAPYLSFFAIGVFLSAHRADALLETPSRRGLLFVFGWAIFTIVFLLPKIYPAQASYAVLVVGITGGCFGVLALARTVAPFSRWLIALGQASMPIYLLHVMVAAVVRIVLLHFAPGLPVALLLLLLSAVGITIPFLIARAAAYWGVEQWLGFARTAQGKARLVPATRIDG